jgi:hypothetical protein
VDGVDGVGVAAWFMAKFLWLKFCGVLGHWLMLDEIDGSHSRMGACLIKDKQPIERRCAQSLHQIFKLFF